MNPNQAQHQSAAASRALLVAALAGILLIPSMFLSWFGPSALAKSKFADRALPSQNAWEAFSKLDAILALTAILGAGLALIIWSMARRRGVPGWPMLGGVLVGAIGTIGAVLLLGRMINPPGENDLQSVLLRRLGRPRAHRGTGRRRLDRRHRRLQRDAARLRDHHGADRVDALLAPARPGQQRARRPVRAAPAPRPLAPAHDRRASRRSRSHASTNERSSSAARSSESDSSAPGKPVACHSGPCGRAVHGPT